MSKPVEITYHPKPSVKVLFRLAQHCSILHGRTFLAGKRSAV